VPLRQVVRKEDAGEIVPPTLKGGGVDRADLCEVERLVDNRLQRVDAPRFVQVGAHREEDTLRRLGAWGVLGLRLEDLRSAERRVFVVDGKGGHQRWVPISSRFFASVTEYLHRERPAEVVTDRVFVVLKGPHRGRPLTAKGLEQIMRDARRRAGLSRGTCHELRHTCLTRLREAGMALEAIQAQAGHRSIESTRIYLHLADGWVAAEYRKAAEAIDAQARVGSGS
jgi:hypothetical protein